MSDLKVKFNGSIRRHLRVNKVFRFKVLKRMCKENLYEHTHKLFANTYTSENISEFPFSNEKE